MTTDEFLDSLMEGTLPGGMSAPLRGLWHSARGDWDRAHNLVQDDPSADAAWVHAHLHRIEGDLANAEYWYRRAGRPSPNGPIEVEQRQIASSLLGE